MEVNGVDVPVRWGDDDTWQVPVSLASGANLLVVEAFDFEGSLVGSDTITITNTSLIEPATASGLVVTELMYHPRAPSLSDELAGFASEDDFEFVEVLNTSTNAVELGAARFSEGITFVFPVDTILPMGERLIVAANPAAFGWRYGASGVAVLGPFDGKLSNSGETVVLRDYLGEIVFSLTYNDSGAWSAEADGEGYSLVHLDPVPGAELDEGRAWSPSRYLDGGAGEEDLFSYPLWVQRYPALAAAGQAGPAHDFDQDGDSNYHEFALQSDPTNASSRARVRGTLVWDGGKRYIDYAYTGPIATPSLRYLPATARSIEGPWEHPLDSQDAVYQGRQRAGDQETHSWRSRMPVSEMGSLLFRVEMANP